MSFAIAGPVGSLLSSALDGIAERQRVIADNIANVDTPGYRAVTVDFETSLRAAIANGDTSGDLQPALLPTDTPVGVNGNNVDLRHETMAAVQTQFQYQIMTRATNDRFELIRSVAN